jgi:hypothetical protein
MMIRREICGDAFGGGVGELVDRIMHVSGPFLREGYVLLFGMRCIR